MRENLPEELEQALNRLAKRTGGSEVARRLRERWLAGEPAQRSEIERLLLRAGARFSFPRYLAWSLTLLPLLLGAGALGIWAWGEHQDKQLLQSGLRLQARVERLEPGWCWLGFKGRSCVHLRLELEHPVRGRLQVEADRSVPELWLPQLQPGSRLFIWVDPRTPQLWCLDEGSLSGSSELILPKN